jgi:hypothetical protein
MNQKSLNQLYKEQVKYNLTIDPFKTWIQKGKELYDRYKSTEMIAPDVTFEMFANMIQPQIILHDDGTTSSTSFWDTQLGNILKTGVTVGADLINKAAASKTTTSPTSSTSTNTPVPAPASNTILGLKPIVFYSITTVIVIAVGFGLYKLVAKKS